jgi:hypothetical protein
MQNTYQQQAQTLPSNINLYSSVPAATQSFIQPYYQTTVNQTRQFPQNNPNVPNLSNNDYAGYNQRYQNTPGSSNSSYNQPVITVLSPNPQTSKKKFSVFSTNPTKV